MAGPTCGRRRQATRGDQDLLKAEIFAAEPAEGGGEGRRGKVEFAVSHVLDAVEAGPGWTLAGTIPQSFLLDLGAGATLSNGSTTGGVVLATGAILHNDGSIASASGIGIALDGPSLAVNQAVTVAAADREPDGLAYWPRFRGW